MILHDTTGTTTETELLVCHSFSDTGHVGQDICHSDFQLFCNVVDVVRHLCGISQRPLVTA